MILKGLGRICFIQILKKSSYQIQRIHPEREKEENDFMDIIQFNESLEKAGARESEVHIK
jgi:hypothetical protein